MSTLKELSNIYLSDLSEGLLDDIDDNLSAGDDYVYDEMLSKWAVGNKFSIVKKKNGYILKGNFKITDISRYDGPEIKEVIGNLSISKTGLTNLDGLFKADAEIKGSLTIEDNDNLVSLKGCPLIVTGSLTITGNKSLKEIDYSPNVYINAYVSKNGKKFKKEYLDKQMHVYKHIFCAVDEDFVIESEESETINEAFKAPELSRIMDSIKKASVGTTDPNAKFTMRDISNRIPWDKLDSSNIMEISTDDDECYKMIRKFTSRKIGDGIMACIDEDGDVYSIVYSFHKTISVLQLKPRWNPTENYINSQRSRLTKYSSTLELKPTQLLEYVKDDGNYWSHKKFDSVMFITWGLEHINMQNTLRSERVAAKRGATALMRGNERNTDTINKIDIRYYQSIANENRSRYKTLITQIRANRAMLSNNFVTLKQRIDRAFDRYTALLAKLLQNPTNYSSYDIEWLNDAFHDVYVTKHGTRTSGLFKHLERYASYIVNISKGDTYRNDNIKETINGIEYSIKDALDRIERELTKLEAK